MKIEELIKDENWLSARFGNDWKEYALKELTINELIDLSIMGYISIRTKLYYFLKELK